MNTRPILLMGVLASAACTPSGDDGDALSTSSGDGMGSTTTGANGADWRPGTTGSDDDAGSTTAETGDPDPTDAESGDIDESQIVVDASALLGFTNHGNGTFTHHETSLVWVSDVECIPSTPWMNALSIAAAFPDPSPDACSVADGSSPGDWRLPNINELVTLTDFDFARPAVSPQTPLVNLGQGKHFWASTSHAETGVRQQARILESLDGHVRRAAKTSEVIGVLLIRDANDDELPTISAAAGPAEFAEATSIVLRGVDVLEQNVATSQTECYGVDGEDIECEGSGMDGELRRGYRTDGDRFVDNADGTVTDRWTEEVWMQAHSCLGFENFHPAQELLAELADPACGLSDGSVSGDWAVPSPKQFHQFSHWGQFAPAVEPGSPFSGVYTYRYWSSRLTAPTLGLQAWAFNMGNGVITTDSPAPDGQQWNMVGIRRHVGPQEIECEVLTAISPAEAIIECAGKGRRVQARLVL